MRHASCNEIYLATCMCDNLSVGSRYKNQNRHHGCLTVLCLSELACISGVIPRKRSTDTAGIVHNMTSCRSDWGTKKQKYPISPLQGKAGEIEDDVLHKILDRSRLGIFMRIHSSFNVPTPTDHDIPSDI